MAVAAYPSSVVDRTALPFTGDFIEVATTLTGSVAPGTPAPFTLPLADTSELANDGYLVVGSEDFREVMKYDSKTPTDVNVVIRDVTNQNNLTHTLGDDAFVGPVALYTDQRSAEVIAIETELGTLPKGTFGTVTLRLDNVDTEIAALQAGTGSPDPFVKDAFIANVSVSVGTNPAASGELRFANTEGIRWRNSSNDQDIGIRVGSNNVLSTDYGTAFPSGVDLVTSSSEGIRLVSGGGATVIGTNAYLSIGTNPATNGALNVSNGAEFRARNAANTGNITLLGTSAADRVLVGSASHELRMQNDTLPSGDNTNDIGSSSIKWRSGYFGTNVNTPAVRNSGLLELLTTNANDLRFGTNGGTQWHVKAADGSLVPAVNNTIDIGSAASQVRTGYFGTSVVTAGLDTPSIFHATGEMTVGTTGAFATKFRQNTLTRWLISSGNFLPNLDNTYDFGSGTAQVRTGFFGTSVVTPLVQSPGGGLLLSGGAASGMILQSGGVNRVIMSDTGDLYPAGNNTQDLGLAAGGAWRTGYFGTSVSVGTNPASAGEIRLPNDCILRSRLASNLGDVDMIGVSASDVLFVGQGANVANITIGAGIPGNIIAEVKLRPGADNTLDLGQNGREWANAWFGTSAVYSETTAVPGATVGHAKTYVDPADGDFKIIFGDGTIKTLATNP